MAEEPLVQAMVVFSGIGLILAFLIFTRLALKAKNTGSFRFQLSIFMLIWLMAEIPKVANTLGIISTAGFGLYGLTFHMVSMFAFAFFIGAKSFLFIRTTPMPNMSTQTKMTTMRQPPTGETQP